MGRKGTLTFVLLLGGGACFISGFIPKGKPSGHSASLMPTPTPLAHAKFAHSFRIEVKYYMNLPFSSTHCYQKNWFILVIVPT